ncbi:MAG: hypothetical protein ACREBO_09705 [Novosphingobium sp.]
MLRTSQTSGRGGAAASVLLAGAVALLALPSAVLAFSSRFSELPPGLNADGGMETIVPGRIDPRLARSISVRALARGAPFRFTPADTSSRSGREVTVAVRLDAMSSRSILVRAPVGGGEPVANPLRIAPMAYNLGVSRGYKAFAANTVVPSTLGRVEMPDLASFQTKDGAKGDPARFSPRIALDERANAGRAPRTFEGDGEQTVDVGGAYRVGRNLNVTAGVRYSQERDRLAPLVDGKQDGQAVYVGTQFRF